MDIALKQSAICSLVVSFFLTACGGGGSNSPSQPPSLNKAPVASSDNAVTLDSEAVIIEVLANDSDPENDPLTISSISVEPEFGTVTINDNSITYTPEQYYAGSDSFSYRISDGSLSSQAQVHITNSQSYTLSGVVIDEPIADATVTVDMSDKVFTATADKNGAYSLTIVFDDANAVLLLNAKGSTQNQQESIELVSYLGSFTDIVELPNTSRQLTADQNAALNITQFSTANYLLAVEKNNGVSPVNMGEFRKSVDQFTAAELTTLIGFIKLLVDNPDYNVPENSTTLTVLQGPDNSLYESIKTYLIQQELWDEDKPSANYLADLQTAIEQSFEQQYLTGAFTEEMLLGRKVISLVKNKSGLLPASADVYQFSEDKQGVSHSSGSNVLTSFSDDFSWEIENGQLNISYSNLPHLTDLPFYDYGYILSVWGLETAQEVKELFDRGEFFQLEVLTKTVSEKISVLSKGERQATISSEKEIEHIIKIYDIYTATATETVTETRSFLFNPETTLADKSDEDIAGTWAMSLNYTFITDVNGDTTDLQYGLGDQFDIVTFNLDGTASGLLSKNVYTWQFANGTITLETDKKKFILTPLIESGLVQMAAVEYYNENELENITVRQMMKSNTAQVTATDLVVELPFTYVQIGTNFSPDLSQEIPSSVESIFGYNLTDNFEMRRVFSSVEGHSSSPITLFRNDATSWSWSETDNRLIFNRELFNFKQQSTWHVLSKDENGRIYIVKYSSGADDFDNDGTYENAYPLINPRLTILEQIDLSQYDQIWANSLENGSLSGL
ncbi:hypothetical protein FX988_02818 [Paraglaciecola mesophila]|uniref:Lipoprotein n=1 Tax=Paraglaciecola mesophila TaxID=197222 RepID=A0A857JNG8_9ALTE|nr:Ig-like domain-containing protein [Paraglaciecola mesophila]QHJ12561.1 hypothetical protein FX988_02818 [Paraglaciecola mesophila]